MDNDLSLLRKMENSLNRRVITATANHQYLSSALEHADVVIGAAMKEGERSPCWVTEEMVIHMRQGSVIVDTVIDEGGCVDTSHATTSTDPVFTRHGVSHYCVHNIVRQRSRSIMCHI